MALVTSPLGGGTFPGLAGAPPGEAVPAHPEPTPERTSRLRLTLEHRFESGRIDVRIDGTSELEQSFRGDGGKSTWTRTLPIAAGRHRIEVRVASDDKSYDEIEGVEGTFHDGQTRILELSTGFLSRRLKMRFEEADRR